MLVYSIIFILLSIAFIDSDISNEYSLFYSVWMALSYLMMSIGNLLFVFDKNVRDIKRVWKILFPVYIINLIVSLIIDKKYGDNLSLNDGLLFNLVVFIIVAIIFLPAFRANYKIAYKNPN